MNIITSGSSVISNLPNLENQAINAENQNPQQINAPQNVQTGTVGIDTGLQALQRAETANLGLKGIEGKNNTQPVILPQNTQPVHTKNRPINSGNISIGLNEIENGAVQNQPANGPADLPAQEAYNKLSLINDIITQLQPTDPSLLFIVKNFFSNLVNLICGHNWQNNDEALIRENTIKFLHGTGDDIVLDTANKYLKCTNINDKIRIASDLAYITTDETIKNAAVAFLTSHNDDNLQQVLRDYQNRQTPDYGRLLYQLRTDNAFMGQNMVRELCAAFNERNNATNQITNPETIEKIATIIEDELSKAAIGWAQKHFDIDPQCHDIRNVLVFCPHEELLGKYPGFNGLTFGQKMSVLEQVMANLNDHNNYLSGRYQFDKDDNTTDIKGNVMSRRLLAQNNKDYYLTEPLTEKQKTKNREIITYLQNFAASRNETTKDFVELKTSIGTLTDLMEKFCQIPDDKFETDALALSFQIEEAQNDVRAKLGEMFHLSKENLKSEYLTKSEPKYLNDLIDSIKTTSHNMNTFFFGDSKVNIDYFFNDLQKFFNNQRMKEAYPQLEGLGNLVTKYYNLVKEKPESKEISTLNSQIYFSMHNFKKHMNNADQESFEKHFEKKFRILLGEDPAFINLKTIQINRQDELKRHADFVVNNTLKAINFDTDKSLQSVKNNKSPVAINLMATILHNCPSADELAKCLAPLKNISEAELNDFLNDQIGGIVNNLDNEGVNRLLHFLYSGRYLGITQALKHILEPVDTKFNSAKTNKEATQNNIAQNEARLNQAVKDNNINIQQRMDNLANIKVLKDKGMVKNTKIEIENNKKSIINTLNQQTEERIKSDSESIRNSLKTDNDFALAKAKYDLLKDQRLVYNVLTKVQEITFKQIPGSRIPTDGFVTSSVPIITSESQKEFTNIRILTGNCE